MKINKGVSLPSGVVSRLKQAEMDLAANHIPIGFQRFPGTRRHASIKLGPRHRAIVTLETSPWRITHVMTHEDYNNTVDRMRRTGEL